LLRRGYFDETRPLVKAASGAGILACLFLACLSGRQECPPHVILQGNSLLIIDRPLAERFAKRGDRFINLSASASKPRPLKALTTQSPDQWSGCRAGSANISNNPFGDVPYLIVLANSIPVDTCDENADSVPNP